MIINIEVSMGLPLLQLMSLLYFFSPSLPSKFIVHITLIFRPQWGCYKPSPLSTNAGEEG
jgi:hypothetical protein